jgi:peroxiredoxin
MPFTLPLGTKAPLFSLIGTDLKKHSLSDYSSPKVVLIFFTCNHCPYVIGSDEITRKTAEKFKDKGVQFIAINSNSKNTYTEDSFDHMIERMKLHHFPWIYLHDESQEIAKKYGALRTPHFFVFDEEKKLIYCGRGIDTPRDASKMSINDLDNALSDHFLHKKIRVPLTNPIGCNVKWDGKEKHWMPAEACDLV